MGLLSKVKEVVARGFGDDELKRIYKSSSGDMKIAAEYILKQRSAKRK